MKTQTAIHNIPRVIDRTDAYRATARDYYQLLKPRVMVLVVFTGIVGLILAPGNIHPFIAVTAIFCLALGSGAAGAFNMWYERELDAVMERTKKRPLPMGHVLPENAFDFAQVSAFAAVFLMAAAVNFTAALLLLGAMLFYVLVYTIYLKPRTPQNIVIGGAAGAFPPLIGWAAVTGNVSLEPVILFLITFLWTPPHFWALSLYRAGDYAKAGIPMMPVVAGKASTKRQMLAYTLILLPVSLAPYFMGFSFWLYGAGACLLGLNFIRHAILVLHADESAEERVAKRMFVYSLLYLTFIFTLLIIDHYLLG